MRSEPVSPQLPDPRLLPKVFARYREPSLGRSIAEIVITAIPFVALWVLMWASLQVGYWLCLLLAVPAAGFLVRLFVIQHDCSHGAFFRRRAANDWVGRIIGVFTLTPHDYWRRSHAMHHAGSGNLARRGIGEVITKTVNEYRDLDWRGRLTYRVYRHPLLLFVLAPTFLFFFAYRLPLGVMNNGSLWVSTMLTNLGIVALVAGLVWLVGVESFLMVQIPMTMIASSIGVWLFYVQHQFEQTSWDPDPDWSHPVAALHGSSHYDLPVILQWFTANIGVHHVHHLSSRIPYYRLREVLRDHPKLSEVGRLGFLESLGCVRLVLWDEGRRRLVSFREMWRNAAADAATDGRGARSRFDGKSATA
jgi:acyl-lipid omega-6 desaturase (Delta-12 desaturase)